MGIKTRPYRDYKHGTFEEEWGAHADASEWWYATGYVFDSGEKLYTYQFTLNRVRVNDSLCNLLLITITDFESKRHLYTQKVAMTDDDITIDDATIKFGDAAVLKKEKDCMTIRADTGEGFSYDLKLSYGKGAFWHCDNGVLKMGTEDCKSTTLYYSYTNMPTVGNFVIDGVSFGVKGKSWFDKQGGIFNVLDSSSHWEWFSLRFYDDEEIMLFAYPQNDYFDGTYIPQNGDSTRLNNYILTPLTFEVIQGDKYSTSWKLSIPGIKEEEYSLLPINDAQKSGNFLEVLCNIINTKGDIVGFCYAELLPGVYGSHTFDGSTLRSDERNDIKM